MISIIKETVLSALQEWIEQEGDHVLRIARIRQVRILLDKLEAEADRTIKPIDMPLWYVEKHMSYYGIYSYSGIEDGSWVLVREDVEPELLKWVSKNCSGAWWYGEDAGGGSGYGKQHPIYSGFSNYVTIGNKVTPAKRYFQGRIRCSADSLREGMIKNFGPKTWTKDTLPKDINGKPIYG